MLVSVIIRTLNESRYLDELLTVVRGQELDDTDLEVVVIDSGSTDGTLEIAAKHGCRVTHITRESFSFGRSLNMGVEFSTGEILIFISGHCVPVDNNWLQELIGPITSGSARYCYGRQIGGDSTKYSEHNIFRKYFPDHHQTHQPEFYCNNANSALHRSAWHEFRFDESLTGLEDMELAKRLCMAGGVVQYVPTACVYHIHDESWAQTKRRYEREAIALHAIMPEVHVSFGDFIRYFIASVSMDVSTALNERRLVREFVGIVKFRFAQYYGGYRGNHEHRQLSQAMKERYFFPGSSPRG